MMRFAAAWPHLRGGNALNGRKCLTLLTCSIAALMLSPAAPAAAQRTVLVNSEIVGLNMTQEGVVRVTGSYACPSGYSASTNHAMAYVYQFALDYLYRAKAIGSRVTCDGTTHEVAVKFRKAEGAEPFHPDIPFGVGFDLRPENSDGDVISALDRETRTTEGAIATIEVRNVGFNENGGLRLTGTYVCPEGSTVVGATAMLWQLARSGDHYRQQARKNITERLDCDGTRKDVAVTFPESQDVNRWVPGLQTFAGLDLSPSNIENRPINTYEFVTAIPEA